MHKLVAKDLESGQGVCAVCGPVALHFRTSRGKKQVRCSIAVARQKDSPNRYKNWHGVPTLEAQAMRENASCALCGHDKHLVIDHCHSTGKVRAVLCSWCNSMLGFARDNAELLEAGATYIREHKEAGPSEENPAS
jgi:hypothetical protein